MQRITRQHFWSSLRQQTRLGREEGSYRGRVLFWDEESLLDFLCCQVSEQEEG